MRYAFKKSLLVGFVIVIFTLMFMFFTSGSKVSASDDMRVNERKFFTSYVVEDGDTLWSIAETYMTKEYASTRDYINEVKKSNHLGSDMIHEGQLLVLPYYADAPYEVCAN